MNPATQRTVRSYPPVCTDLPFGSAVRARRATHTHHCLRSSLRQLRQKLCNTCELRDPGAHMPLVIAAGTGARGGGVGLLSAGAPQPKVRRGVAVAPPLHNRRIVAATAPRLATRITASASDGPCGGCETRAGLGPAVITKVSAKRVSVQCGGRGLCCLLDMPLLRIALIGVPRETVSYFPKCTVVEVKVQRKYQ